MEEITVTIHDEWPQLKCIINTRNGATVSKSYYDVALTNFEVGVKNALRIATENIIQRRKRAYDNAQG